jgi:hypothetical protein
MDVAQFMKLYYVEFKKGICQCNCVFNLISVL